jgi:hypothetical protein
MSKPSHYDAAGSTRRNALLRAGGGTLRPLVRRQGAEYRAGERIRDAGGWTCVADVNRVESLASVNGCLIAEYRVLPQ